MFDKFIKSLDIKKIENLFKDEQTFNEFISKIDSFKDFFLNVRKQIQGGQNMLFILNEVLIPEIKKMDARTVQHLLSKVWSFCNSDSTTEKIKNYRDKENLNV